MGRDRWLAVSRPADCGEEATMNSGSLSYTCLFIPTGEHRVIVDTGRARVGCHELIAIYGTRRQLRLPWSSLPCWMPAAGQEGERPAFWCLWSAWFQGR